MKDMLGREIPKFGLCVAKSNGRGCLYYGLKVTDKSILIASDRPRGYSVKSFNEYVWIDQPSPDHQKVIDSLMPLCDKYHEGFATKKEAQQASYKGCLSKFEKGHVYRFTKTKVDPDELCWLYVGKAKYIRRPQAGREGRTSVSNYDNLWLGITKDAETGRWMLGAPNWRTYVERKDAKKPKLDEHVGEASLEEILSDFNKYALEANIKSIAQTEEENRQRRERGYYGNYKPYLIEDIEVIVEN